MKRLMGYLFLMMFFGIFVYWGARYGQNLKIQAGRTFELHSLYAYIAFYPVIIGMLLAVPGLIHRIRQAGKWRIDWQMLLVIGLPTLLFNIQPLMSLLLQRPFLFQYDWYKLLMSDTRVYDICGIVCGYVLLTSLTRIRIVAANYEYIER